MKRRWKKLFLWSWAGGLAAGAAVALVHRSRRRPEVPLKCVRIPPNCRRASLWTEHFETEDKGIAVFACERYILQATKFKVWSVLDTGGTVDASAQRGAAVFHITHSRTLHPAEAAGGSAAAGERLVDRFYGTVRVVSRKGSSCGVDSVARGGILEIRKCLVGGAANGVETGEVHRSAGRILNYRFECDSPSSEAASVGRPGHA